MQMLANGGIHNGEHILGRKTIDLIRTNTLTPTMIKEDFSNDYLAGYGYGYGMRTLTATKVSTMACSVSLAGPVAPEPGQNVIRKPDFPLYICTICSQTSNNITI